MTFQNGKYDITESMRWLSPESAEAHQMEAWRGTMSTMSLPSIIVIHSVVINNLHIESQCLIYIPI